MLRATFCVLLLSLTASGRVGNAEHPGRRDDRLERLFAPPAMPRDTYRVYVTGRPVDDVAAGYRARAKDPSADAWRPERQSFSEAVGTAGVYDRGKVARLYGGRGPRVARGTRMKDGITEAIVLISPYPDPSLTRLEGGTMILVLRMQD